MKTDDPICGNCGKKRSEHCRKGDEGYCYSHTYDEFASTPSDKTLMLYMRQNRPSMVREMQRLWRQENGHE